MPKAKKDQATADAGYAELRRQLDGLVEQMQAPDCGVDQAAQLYEQALQVIAQLETYLEKAENRVKRAEASFQPGGTDG